MAFDAEYHRLYYYKRRQAIFEYLGGKCASCGTVEELQVDHIDRSQKSFDISRRLSVKNTKKELDKCQLLCKTCHTLKTAEENSGFTHGTVYGWMKKKCDCTVCSVAKLAYYVIRNNKRRSSNSTRAPYQQVTVNGEIVLHGSIHCVRVWMSMCCMYRRSQSTFSKLQKI